VRGWFFFQWLALAAGSGAASQARAQIRGEPWGTTREGTPVERVTLQNARGMRLAYIDYGATLVAAEVRERSRRRANVMLSLPDLPSYENKRARYGAVMGRYAGRIGGARFTLGGETVNLAPNKNGVALHGGPDGYDKRVWRRRDFADKTSIGSVFTLTSPDGDQGFPGRVELSVTYRLLRARDEFRIEYAAVSDAPTVINLTNHAFFNLAGAGAPGLSTHRFQLYASRYAAADGKKIPTGLLADVAGTPLDLRRPAGLGPRLAAPSALLRDPPEFDHSLLADKPPGHFGLVAVVDEVSSGRRMEIRSTEPSIQFNNGGGFDGSETGSEGRTYRRGDGFAIETQHLPDSPNHANFPSTALGPGQRFQSVTSYRFLVTPATRYK
jgi:aldose 1-epimerase